MNNLKELLKKMGKPIRTISYWCDYIDKAGNCYNRKYETLDLNIDDSIVVNGIIENLKNKGYTVYSIVQIKGEHTQDKIIKHMTKDLNIYNKYVRPLYIDFNILGRVLNNNKC